mgnify:CR=1 FL=1
MNLRTILFSQYPALFLLAVLFLIAHLRVRKTSAVKSVLWVILFGAALAASVVCCFLGIQAELWTLKTLITLGFWSWFGVGLVLLFLVLRVSPQEVGLQPLGSGPVASEGGSAPVYGLTLAQAMRSFRFWALIFTALIVGLTSTMLSNTIVPHLSDIGYAATYASGVMSCYMGLLAVCKILLGGMYDRLGMRKSTFISVSAILVGLLGLYFGAFQPMHLFIVAGAALGCAVGTVAYPILTQSAFGTRAYATIYGIITAANSLASSVCPIFTNSVYDGTGSYRPALVTSIVLALAVLGLLFTIRPLRPEEMNRKPDLEKMA